MSHGSIRWIKQYWEELSQFITISHNSGPPFSVVMIRNALLSWLFWTCILKIYIHSPVVMASKVQQVAISKGVKKKHIWLDIDKEIRGFKHVPESPDYHRSTALYHFLSIHIYLGDNPSGCDSVISSLYVWNQLNECEPGEIV